MNSNEENFSLFQSKNISLTAFTDSFDRRFYPKRLLFTDKKLKFDIEQKGKFKQIQY